MTGVVTFILIGMSVLMTNVLGHIPMPVLYGVFLYMGISALGGMFVLGLALRITHHSQAFNSSTAFCSC